MSRQNANTASGSSRNRRGNFAGSGSRPTHTSEPESLQRCLSCCMNVIAPPSSRGGLPAGATAPRLLQRLEAQPLRAGVVAHAALLVFLVFAVVALEELHVRIPLEG